MTRYPDTPKSNSPQAANLNVALELAKDGLAVFPARAETKRPHVKDWPNVATTDPEQLRDWWRRWPDAMPALPTGERNGFDVLDLDRKDDKDGFATLRAMGHDPDRLAGPSLDTPTGGRHIYFRHTPGLRSSAGKIGPGVDVRAEGGFVVAPGAINGKGAYGRLSGPLNDLAKWPAGLTPPPRAPRKSKGEKTGLPFAEVADALMAIPNDGSNPDDDGRDWWLYIGMALHHETDGDEEGRDLFHRWCDQHHKYDFDKTEAAWDSFGGEGRTAATILREAYKHGWHNAAAHERRLTEDLELLDDCWTPEELIAPSAQAALEELDRIVYGEDKAPPFFLDMADMLEEEAPPREWHVQDWIPAKTVHMLAGDGGSGKSLLGIQLAVATGTGADWLGHDVSKPGVALYYGAEDDKDELHRRFADVCRGLEVDPAEHRGRVLLRSAVAEDTVFATVAKDGKVKPTAVLKSIEREVATLQPTLVVLDTLANLHALDPNSQEQAKAFVSLLVGFCQRFGCTILLLAHPSRTGMASGDGDGFSVGWSNSVRSRSYLAADNQSPGINILTSKKANYGQRGLAMKMTWHEGCYIKVNDEYADASKAKHVFLEILDRLWKQKTFVSNTTGPNYAPSRFAEEPEAEEDGFTKEVLAKAMKAMLKDGNLIVEEYTKNDRKPGKRLARGDVALTASELDHLLEGEE